MQLTGKQIVEKGIITNSVEAGLQQQGIDLRVKNIKRVYGNAGEVPAQGKTITPSNEDVFVKDNIFFLGEGYYEIEFEEGCNIPRDATLHIKTRSSLVRCGCQCYSGQFDGGFHTDNMGCFMHVILPTRIEKGARLAQAIVFESYPVDDDKLYNGQWQGDKQREK